jgi:hypothetical protein
LTALPFPIRPKRRPLHVQASQTPRIAVSAAVPAAISRGGAGRAGENRFDHGGRRAAAQYKRGAELLKYCQAALQDAQQQVKVLEDGILRDFKSDDGDNDNT